MFDAFISYSRSDHAAVSAAAEALAERGLKLFFDRWELAAGQPWQALLAARLADCRAVIVFIGPGDMGSWQEREKRLALDRQTREPGFPVVPVLLPGVRNPSLDFLGLNTWIDLSGGVENGEELDALAAAIEGHPLGRSAERRDPRAEICPYRGLSPFREEDAALFFGRDAFAEALQSKVAEKRFLGVIGASGSGKSSVVRAGLFPRLRSDMSAAWDFITLVPGDNPLGVLASAFDPPPDGAGLIDAIEHTERGAAALREGRVSLDQLTKAFLDQQDGTERLFLFIDQSEELYTLTPEDKTGDRERFIDLILSATNGDGPLNIVFTMRGDFYARALSRRDLADRLQDAVVNIGPLSAEGEPISELEMAVRRPAEAVGLTFEDGLVERILQDVGTEPGNLPLLEFLLTELWAARKSGVLTNAAYSDLGGVAGAVAARADALVAAMPGEEAAIKRLLLMLVRPGQGQEDTRARARIPEDAVLQTLLRRFTEARLVVTSGAAADGGSMEVSHEALIKNWRRLRPWVDENRDLLRIRDRVQDRMERWMKAKRDPSLLLPAGLDLEEGRRLVAEAGDVAVDDVEIFVTASIEAERRRLADLSAEKEAAQRKELHRQKRARNVIAGALAVSLAFFAVAVWQFFIAEARSEAAGLARLEAETERAAAETARDAAKVSEALAEEEAARAEAQLLKAQLQQARYLAGKALDLAKEGASADAVALARLAMPRANLDGWPPLDQIPEAPFALSQSLGALKELRALRGHEDGVRSATFSPDGARIVTASSDDTARVWDAETGAEIAAIRGHEDNVLSAAFSRDGARIVTASIDDTARVWDAETGAEIAVLRGHKGNVASAAFSPDGTRVVTASNDDTARVWDAATGVEIAALHGHGHQLSSAAFSPDGTSIVTSSFDLTARLWDAENGVEIAVLRGHSSPVLRAAFSPDGARIVTSSFDNTARVWDAETGAEIAVLGEHNDIVLSAAFSHDGSRIVTTSFDNTARVWDAATAAEVGVLRGHEGSVTSAAFSPDGTRIITSSVDATARVWDTETGAEIAALRGHEDTVRSISFSPDGARIVTASSDNTARVWDAEVGAEIAALRGHENTVRSAAFSPDGARIVTASYDNTSRVWDAATEAEIVALRGHEDYVESAAFSPDGARIVTSSLDATARIWDAETGTGIAVLRGHKHVVLSAAFSPDGARIVTASYDSTSRVWDVATGAEIVALRGHEDYVESAAFSPDGARIVTASYDITSRIWDAETGAEIAVLRGHKDVLNSAAFSPDGARIVTSSVDTTARVWDAETGAEIAVLRGHKGNVASAAFSPDGARVVTASNDDTARVWDAETGVEIAALRGHELDVNSAAFSPDGTRIVTTSEDGTARIWRAYPTHNDLFNAATEVVERLLPLSDKDRCDYYLTVEGC